MCYQKLREKFDENRHVSDLRTIDMLIIKVKIDLQVAIVCFLLSQEVDFFYPN